MSKAVNVKVFFLMQHGTMIPPMCSESHVTLLKFDLGLNKKQISFAMELPITVE